MEILILPDKNLFLKKKVKENTARLETTGLIL